MQLNILQVITSNKLFFHPGKYIILSDGFVINILNLIQNYHEKKRKDFCTVYRKSTR